MSEDKLFIKIVNAVMSCYTQIDLSVSQNTTRGNFWICHSQ